jgi:hypothetical protein
MRRQKDWWLMLSYGNMMMVPLSLFAAKGRDLVEMRRIWVLRHPKDVRSAKRAVIRVRDNRCNSEWTGGMSLKRS